MIRRPPRSTPFPTRRSSDLALGNRPGGEVHMRVGEPGEDAAAAEIDDLGRRERSLVRTDAAGDPFPGDRDRKSTRLNSSHLVISYAVFCLKKKHQTAP